MDAVIKALTVVVMTLIAYLHLCSHHFEQYYYYRCS